MIPNGILESTAQRYAARTTERVNTLQKLRTSSPLQADTPERVNKRIAHMTTSEMARVTELAPGQPSASGISTVNVLERIIGKNDLMSVTFLDLALRVSRTVGRVHIKNAAGQLVGYGTGFLIGPRVLLTNNHVLGSPGDAASSQVEFNYQDAVDGSAPASILFGLEPGAIFATDAALDYTIVAVRERAGSVNVSSFGHNLLVGQEGKVLVGECLNIIQHPNGEPKQLALRENQLIDLLPQFVHYHTDTAPGSSGSPVFNDQWEVIALHHSGVPHTDSQGRYLTVDGAIWTPAMGEHRIHWKANEGARVSQIVASLERMTGLNSAARALRDSVLNPRSPIESLGKVDRPPSPVASGDSHSPIVAPDGTATWTLPVQISIRLGNQAGEVADRVPAPVIPTSAPPEPLDGDTLLEKMVVPAIDTSYGNRKGYDADFLGVTVPLPKVTKLSLVAKLEDGEFAIPYQHFSVVMNKKRRMALFTASNVDGRERSKHPEPGRDYSRKGLGGLSKNDQERWTTDPRIPEEHQLPDVFFTKDRQSFDKGHVVRREDVCWGRSYAMVRRANGDTYHTTNCTPQVKGFNQSSQGGLWGEFENFILEQAKAEIYSVFAGPIFSDEDDVFEGVDDRGAVEIQIPSKFWKIVVAASETGIQSFAFVLEQDLTNVQFREFAVNGIWAEHMVAITDLQEMLDGIEFPGVVKASDQFGSPIAETIETRHLEALRIARPTEIGR